MKLLRGRKKNFTFCGLLKSFCVLFLRTRQSAPNAGLSVAVKCTNEKKFDSDFK